MRKKKFVFLFISFGIILLVLISFNRNRRPNIVMIIIDTLRPDKLGCYGFAENISPEIDNLAHHGVLFENAFSQSSWTRSSMGSLLTSLYPRSVGIYKEMYDILNDEFVTLPEVLKMNGYFTLGITANPNLNSFFNFSQGFDQYIDSSVIWDWMTPEPVKRIVDVKKGIDLPQSQEVLLTVLNKVNKLDHTPCYIQILLMDVHSHQIIRDEYKNLYSHYPYPHYYGAIDQVSHDIGEFIERLKILPRWKDTLFIITSDHGQGLDDHPQVHLSTSHGNLLYESQIRVPLIFYHHKNNSPVFKGEKIKQRVRLLDLMPTILEYVGIKRSDNFQGRSLIPLFKNEKADIQMPDHFIFETSWRNVDKISITSGDWEYIENRDNWPGVNRYELQRLGVRSDGKQTDQIEKYKWIAEELQKRLMDWEEKFHKREKTFPLGNLSDEEIQKLKSLGYLK